MGLAAKAHATKAVATLVDTGIDLVRPTLKSMTDQLLDPVRDTFGAEGVPADPSGEILDILDAQITRIGQDTISSLIDKLADRAAIEVEYLWVELKNAVREEIATAAAEEESAAQREIKN